MAAKKAPARKEAAGNKTAPPREKPNQEQARINQLEAKNRQAEKKAGSKGPGSQTESYLSRRSIVEHSENPDKPGDSTVRHALPALGADESGQKGFPQGEYDVVAPAKAAAAPKRSDNDQLIDSHVGNSDPDEITKNLKEVTRLSDEERVLLLETIPVGAVLERSGENQFRLHKGNTFGFGATAAEAIESFVLGAGPSEDAAKFARMEPAVQKEIEERDRKAALRVGQSYDGTPEQVARLEAVQNAKPAKAEKDKK